VLIEVCTNGVKGGRFGPVNQWLGMLLDHVQDLVELLEIEADEYPKNSKEGLSKILSSVSSGLFSTNGDVANQSLQLLQLLNTEFK
jgi:hypothetical protein